MTSPLIPKPPGLKALLLIIFAAFSLGSFESCWAWVNQGFETGNLTGWLVSYGNSVLPPSTASAVLQGPAPNTNGGLTMVHSGTYACQLFSSSGDSNHLDFAQIEQSDIVPPATPWISFWFAAVLSGAHYSQKPTQAPYGSDSFVLAEILGPSGTIYSQRYSWYDNKSQLVDDGLANSAAPWMHLPWTQYYFDLTAYIGQPVTIVYTAYDCCCSGHYSYGYIDDAQWLSTSQVPTKTFTPTDTATNSPTLTPTLTLTATLTPTDSPTNTPTDTPTPCYVNGNTCTPSNTFTPTDTPTITYTPTITSTATNSPSLTPTNSPTSTLTPTFTITYTPTCQTLVWPNPFNPSFAVGNVLKVGCVPDGAKVTIYTLSGEKVIDLSSPTRIFSMDRTETWNGQNERGLPVSSGIYYYVIQKDDKVLYRGKILVVISEKN